MNRKNQTEIQGTLFPEFDVEQAKKKTKPQSIVKKLQEENQQRLLLQGGRVG